MSLGVGKEMLSATVPFPARVGQGQPGGYLSHPRAVFRLCTAHLWTGALGLQSVTYHSCFLQQLGLIPFWIESGTASCTSNTPKLVVCPAALLQPPVSAVPAPCSSAKPMVVSDCPQAAEPVGLLQKPGREPSSTSLFPAAI